jgi:hypothetical protein
VLMIFFASATGELSIVNYSSNIRESASMIV